MQLNNMIAERIKTELTAFNKIFLKVLEIKTLISKFWRRWKIKPPWLIEGRLENAPA
jgi:hypothetical protein